MTPSLPPSPEEALKSAVVRLAHAVERHVDLTIRQHDAYDEISSSLEGIHAGIQEGFARADGDAANVVAEMRRLTSSVDTLSRNVAQLGRYLTAATGKIKDQGDAIEKINAWIIERETSGDLTGGAPAG